MLRVFSIVVLLGLLAGTAGATYLSESITEESRNAHHPSLATDPMGPSMLLYTLDGGGDDPDVVRALNVDTFLSDAMMNYTPVTLGEGSLGRVNWCGDHFVAALVRDSELKFLNTATSFSWDMGSEVIFTLPGEILDVDLWSEPEVPAGADLFVAIEVQVPDEGNAVYACTRQDGVWSGLETVMTGAEVRPLPQVTSGRIYYYDQVEEYEDRALVYAMRFGAGTWSVREAFGPEFGFGGPLDALTTAEGHHEILALGMQPTCPCGTILSTATDYYGHWHPAEDLTQDLAEMNWPKSPQLCRRIGGPTYAFWYQRASGEYLQPLGNSLHYMVRLGGQWMDSSHTLEDIGDGAGIQPDLAISAGGYHAIMAWTQQDSLAGQPLPTSIYVARYLSLIFSDADDDGLPRAPVAVTAWPNPFNPSVRIAFASAREARVRVDVFDARGRRVRELMRGAAVSERTELVWDGRDDKGSALASGVYFVRVQVGQEVRSTKVVLAE